MASNGDLEFIGEVVDVLPAGRYLIRLVDMDIMIHGKMSGKMKVNRITVMQWDYVKIELSEYDMSQGRIVYRFKDPQQAIASTTVVSNEQDISPNHVVDKPKKPQQITSSTNVNVVAE